MGCLSSKEVAYIEQRSDGSDINRAGSLSGDTVLREETEKQKRNDKNIEKYMDYQRQMEMRIKKLLLLGAGSSGKSTLFKQLKCIYDVGFEDTELEACRHTLRQNVIMG
eukprot:831379_1